MSTLSNAAQRDIETVIHPYTNLDAFRTSGPLILDRGEGITVWDTDGKEYIEGMAGLWCTALGYSEQELIDAAMTQMGQLPFTHVFSGKTHEKAAELAERLKAIAPHDASKVLFCGSVVASRETLALAGGRVRARKGVCAASADNRGRGSTLHVHL